jgi:2-polyprenyl-6-methoxyphenol hydroxylase-like FAD-dependent oxidoreductase
MTTTNPDVLIAGAGPTGLFLALCLTRAGVRVRILDPKPGPTQETRAIVVQARTLEFYDQLGLGTEALARGRRFDAVSLWVRGQFEGSVQLNEISTTITPHPYAFILTQDQNEDMLIAQLRTLGVEVEWDTALTNFTQDDAGVTAMLQHGDQTETMQAHYLAGCDGAHSAVRHGLGVNFSGNAYPQSYFVADVTATDKLRADDVNVCLDDHAFLAFFPMPGQHHQRIVGPMPPDAGEHPNFELVRATVEADGLAHVEAVHWFAAYHLHHRVAEHFRAGRAFLLGDAGHVHSPVGGQGMNTGLGDAMNLAWKLAQTIHGADPAILASYEAERLPFAQALVATTDRVFSGITNPSALARFLRMRAAPAIFPALSRLRFIRRILFMTVSQTRIHYPHSPLSSGQAGKIHGGDRLPWVADGASSNFEALRSLDWQMHVYGTPVPELAAWCAQRNIPLHAFPYTSNAHRAGLAEDALYLVRPDGYVGLASPHFDPAALDAYAARWLPKATTISTHAGT